MTTKLLALLLGALNVCCSVAIGAIPLPSPSPSSDGRGFILEGEGPETVWDVNLQPLSADPAAAYVTFRRATLRGALLLTPTPAVPLALATSGAFTGPWYFEGIIIDTSCEVVDAFASLACDVQPAAWISSNGWSVTISSFTGGGFTSTNVTLICDNSPTSSRALPDGSGSLPLSPPTQPLRTPACATTTAGSSDKLLALLLSYNAVQSGDSTPWPAPARLHISLTANISLDLAAWAAASPVITRNTTISAADCRRVTAIDLRGAISIMTVKGGAVLRLACLELSNLATDTLGRSMPRGLLSAAVWAVDVDIPRGSRLVIVNSSLVLTKDEFKWQSYYLSQSLSNSNVYGSVTSLLPSFQALVSASQLIWLNVSSPHTLWRNCTLTSVPRVYETVVPNSFIMRYLGLTMYIADLKMVYSCEDLLYAVRNITSPAAKAQWSPPPRALVLGANISIGPCWPMAAPVAVTNASLMIMGLPDVTTTLDLAGRVDALELASGGSMSLRFLTLIGLGTHGSADEEDVPVSPASQSAIPAPATAAKAPGDELTRATAPLWAIHFVRRTAQVELSSVSVVVPAVELEQYEALRNGRVPAVSYFSAASVYFGASSLAAVQPCDGAGACTANSSAPPGTGPRVLASLAFSSLLLPGIRGSDVEISVWSGQYGNWSVSLYDDVAQGGGGNGGGGGGLEGWRAKVLAAVVGLAALAAAGAAAGVLYGKRWRAIHGRTAAAAAAAAKRRADIEAGDGLRTPAAVLSVAGGGGGGAAAVAMPRRPLYDSFDDPVFELDIVRGTKLSPDDVADILERVNAEAAEFNIQMTEICGSGGFGVVYGGLWHGLKVAIKTLVFSETAPPLLGGQLARQQCIREAAFCCTMHHPNVVATHHYYLKSAKRRTMFDDMLQQLDDNSSDEGDHRRRRTLSPPPPPAEAAAPPSGEALSPSPSGQMDEAPVAPAAASAAAEGGSTEKQCPGDRNPSAAAAAATAGAATAGAAAAGAAAAATASRPLVPRRSFGNLSTFPKFRINRNKAAVTDWRLYLIQEYCDGGTLRQAVDEGRLFRHSGMQPAATAAAPAAVRPAVRPAGGAETKTVSGQRPPPDSLDGGVQTLMIIGKQGRVTYDRFDAGEAATGGGGGAATDASVAADTDADTDGGAAAAAADDAGLMGPIDALLPLIDDEPPAAAGTPDRQQQQQQQQQQRSTPAGGPEATRRPQAAQYLHRPTTMTLDSTVIGTTVTNATCDSTILATTTQCSDVVLAVQPPPQQPPPQPVLPLPPLRAPPARPAAAAPPPPLPPPEEPLPSDLALVIHTALGIASGVAYLHSRNIIHGDLSANNVLLMKTRTEEVPVLAKLSDFGLSVRLEQGQDQLKDVHHGTPYYQSPEVAEHGTCSLAADVYSLGVLLWELFHGQPPWRAKKRKPRQQPRRQQQQQQPAAAAAAAATDAAEQDVWDDPNYRLRACDVLIISPHCPERYARVLRRCLSPDPRDRPSARAVVKSLLRMERSLAAAAAAAGDRTCMTGAPVGAMMALTRPTTMPGRTQDAALLLEDFDAAAAAVAAAVARVTAAPTVAGAPASAGAAAAAAAGAASGSLLPVLDASPGLVAAAAAAARSAAAARQRPAAQLPLAAAASSVASAATATVTGTATASTAAAPSTAQLDAHVRTLE